MAATAPPMRAGERRRRRRSGGFTYFGVLFLVTLTGLGLAIAGTTWTLATKRARERELLWAGTQYSRAIQAYYLQSNGVRRYPDRLEDLLEDQRFPQPRHHLRQLYLDPVSRQPFKTVIGPEGRIAGVYSPSDDTPLKQDNFPFRWQQFKGLQHYSDWQFVADSAKPAASASSAPRAAASAPAR